MRIVAGLFAVLFGVLVVPSCSSSGGAPGAAFGAPCRNDFDCGGLYCVDVQGGICLPQCHTNYDCGPNYVCQSEGRHGTGGHVDVCVLR